MIQHMKKMVSAIEEKLTKKGEPFLVLTLMDRDGSIFAKIWNMSLDKSPLTKGDIIDCRMKVEDYQGQTSYTLESWTKIEEPKSYYFPAIEDNPADLYDEIMEVAQDLREPLKKLVKSIYEKHKDAILDSAAARHIHHNLLGGLLLHTLTMVKGAVGFMDVYPNLDYDLIFAGIILHDIGKIHELSMDELGQVSYTPIGNLHGHMPIGYHLVMSEGEALGTDAEDLMLLGHIILAHQGLREYDACTLPSIPEAYLIYMLDNLDSKMYQFRTLYAEMEPGQQSEKAILTLAGCRPYKRKEKKENEEV